MAWSSGYTNNVRKLVTDGTYMYAAIQGAAIAKISMSNGSTISSDFITYFQSPGVVHGLAISGTKLYIYGTTAANVLEIIIYDLGTNQISVLKTLTPNPLSDNAIPLDGIKIYDNYLYFAVKYPQNNNVVLMQRINILDLSLSFYVNWLIEDQNLLFNMHDMYIFNNTIYVLSNNGFTRIDISTKIVTPLATINMITNNNNGVVIYNGGIYATGKDDNDNGYIIKTDLNGNNQVIFQSNVMYGQGLLVDGNNLYCGSEIYSEETQESSYIINKFSLEGENTLFCAPNGLGGTAISDGEYLYTNHTYYDGDNINGIGKFNLVTGAHVSNSTNYNGSGKCVFGLFNTTLFIGDTINGAIVTMQTHDYESGPTNFLVGIAGLRSLVVEGPYLYFSYGGDTIGRVSVYDPSDINMTWVVNFNMELIQGMCAYNDLLYVSCDFGIFTININTRQTTRIHEYIDVVGGVFGGSGIGIYNNVIYAAVINSTNGDDNSIATFQLDGTLINLTWKTPPYPHVFTINKSILYSPRYDSPEIYIYELPQQKFVWSSGLSNDVYWGKIVSDGTYLYADYSGYIAQISLADGTIITHNLLNKQFIYIGALLIHGTTLYVGDTGSNIWAYDLTNNYAETLIVSEFLGEEIAGLAVYGDYLYCSAYESMLIGRVNLSLLTDKNPSWFTNVDIITPYISDMYVYNNILYIQGLLAIFALNMDTLVFSTIYSVESQYEMSSGIIIYNDIMYVTTYNSENALLSTIATLQLDGTVIDMAWKTVPNAASLTMHETDIYASSYEDGFVYKFTLPAAAAGPEPPQPPAIVCFKEGSKILTDLGYVPIETLRPGDRVMTALNGYKAIEMIGKREIVHLGLKDRIKDQLYKCSAPAFPEVFEDLVITGCHSILVDDFTSVEQRQKTAEVNNNIYITGNKYRLPACVDDRTTVYEEKGTHMIYHLALENEDYYMNYGIYANGLLVETCSRRYLKELANMELIL